MLAVASVRRFVSVIVGYLQVTNGIHREAVGDVVRFWSYRFLCLVTILTT